MSSFTRTIGKRIAKSSMTKLELQEHRESVPQTFRQHEDGIGYDVYHPTRGWKRVSARRVALLMGAA